MKIIAFSGKKQSGKTTAVEDLYYRIDSKYHKFEVSFADYLKLIVLNTFVPDDWEWSIIELNENKTKKLPMGMDIRGCLQWLGTDIFRKADPDCWVNAYKRIIEDCGAGYVLTADVRFPNEVKCIQDLGGHVIRLLRSPHDDQHESETALDWLDGEYFNPPSTVASAELYSELRFDAFVDNREMDIPTQNEAIWKLVNERKWL